MCTSINNFLPKDDQHFEASPSQQNVSHPNSFGQDPLLSFLISSEEIWSNRGMKSDREKEQLRLSLLKKIKAMDRHLCFPKVLCGLSVDSSKDSKDINQYFIRSYIQLMRSASSEADKEIESSEETQISGNKRTKDSISSLLIKSGLLTSKRESLFASSQEESELPTKNQKHATLLGKRKLLKSETGVKQASGPFRILPVFQFSSNPPNNGNYGKEPDDMKESSSITSKIGSIVSSWVPWVNLSFTSDSFEKDSFFKESGADADGLKYYHTTPTHRTTVEKHPKDWEYLALLMRLHKLNREMQKSGKRRRKTQRNPKLLHGVKSGIQYRELSMSDEEIHIYSTAVDIGKKLKDSRQCDYLYNGCPIKYADIIKIIASIRKDMKPSDAQDETVDALSHEIASQSDNRKKTRPHYFKEKEKNQFKKPVTQISHTLPNGEKVLINVQVSGKEEVGEVGDPLEIESPYDDSVPQEDVVGSEEDAPNPEASSNVSSKTKDEANYDDPAISSSYELDDQKFDGDHWKPSSVDILNKVNRKHKTSTSAPIILSKYIITKKRITTSSESPIASSSAPQNTSVTTIKSPKTKSTTKRPMKMRVSTTVSAISPRSTTRRPTSTTSKIEMKVEQFKQKTTTPKLIPTLKTNITLPKGIKTESPTTSHANSTNFTSMSKYKVHKPPQATNDKLHESESVEYQKIIKDSYADAAPNFEFAFASVTSIEKDLSEEEDAFTTKQKKEPQREPVPTTTLSSPLALLTHSFMDQVLAEMYTTSPPQLLRPNKTTTIPKRKRKPPPPISALDKSYSTTSAEAESTEDVNLQKHYNGQEQSMHGTTGKEESGISPLFPNGESGKRRISYKNPKIPPRPFFGLVVVKSSTLAPSLQSNKRKRPSNTKTKSSTSRPTTLTQSYYTKRPLRRNNMTATSKDFMSNPFPLIIEPEDQDRDTTYWVPSYRN